MLVYSTQSVLILGAELNPLALSLIDQSTVLLLQQRPLGEDIVSNPSQLEAISSFPLLLNYIYHHRTRLQSVLVLNLITYSTQQSSTCDVYANRGCYKLIETIFDL